jgi:sulfotransferase
VERRGLRRRALRVVAPKTIHFLAGLPRSGSTLLANILLQNPAIHVTATSGICDMLVQVRNGWDRNDAFQAMDRATSEKVKGNVLRAMLQAYFQHVERPVCIDKNRYWAEFLEMAAEMVGGRDRVKVLVTVRDLRDVTASFEKLYRKTSSLGQLPQEAAMALKFKTALGRLQVFIDDAQPVGRAYNAIRDAVTRGWHDRMHFIDFEDLTRLPGKTMEGIYRFLEVKPHPHDFARVEQLTVEDDFVYGFKDLHVIRQKVEPQPPAWPKTYDDAVFQSPAWKTLEGCAQFWKLYASRPDGPQ